MKSNCIKSELLQKDFLSIMLKLQVTFAKHILVTTSAFISKNALAILILIIYSYI